MNWTGMIAITDYLDPTLYARFGDEMHQRNGTATLYAAVGYDSVLFIANAIDAAIRRNSHFDASQGSLLLQVLRRINVMLLLIDYLEPAPLLQALRSYQGTPIPASITGPMSFAPGQVGRLTLELELLTSTQMLIRHFKSNPNP